MLSHRIGRSLSNARPPRTPSWPATFSTTTPASSYPDTIKNLKIGPDTRVIFQGFTGRQATANAVESLAWGTQIVGGVSPGRNGTHPALPHLPVFPTVRAAMEHLKPDATGVYVAAAQAAAAIEEALEAEVPLIVAVAEHIPVHDILKIHSMLKSQSKCRLVGANAPGIISAIGRCRIGFQPIPCYSPGHVGIVAKSGTLTYETVAALTRAGVGQSLCIGMGGDIVAGTDFVDALKVFEHDPDTHGVIIVGEVGGQAEEEAAEWISHYKKRCPNPKPIAALVAGKLAKPGYVMGHAGAWAGVAENSAEHKYRRLQHAGVVMVDHPTQFGKVMRELLPKSLKSEGANQTRMPAANGQRRQYHTYHRPSTSTPTVFKSQQRRSLHLPAAQASDLLLTHGVRTTREATGIEAPRLVSVTIDRSSRGPCFLVCQTADPDQAHASAKRIPFDFREGPPAHAVSAALEHLGINGASDAARAAAQRLLSVLHEIFMAHEGTAIEAKIAVPGDGGADALLVYDPRFTFDDAAFRSCGRHPALHALRDAAGAASAPDADERAAEADGIIYVKLGPADTDDPDYARYNIGTLVNGAGLALNTVDALRLAGGRATNFLDTGGKATAETVKAGFALLLADARVRVIFVNVFGGLTLGDMIARGVLLAFRELQLEERGMPVVVRIRGTNEAEGQRILAESGLRVYAFDGFDEAAAKCVELAGKAEQL